MSNPIPGDDAERAIFDVLYEMRLALRHQLEEAAKRIAALPADVAADIPTWQERTKEKCAGFTIETVNILPAPDVSTIAGVRYQAMLDEIAALRACLAAGAPAETKARQQVALQDLADQAQELDMGYGAPAETVKAVIVVNDVGNELAIERRDDGKWQFTPTTFDGQRPQIATPSPSAEVARDAARWQWMIEKFGQTHLPCFLEDKLSCGYIADGKADIDAVIDDAIAAMKLQAPAKEGAK